MKSRLRDIYEMISQCADRSKTIAESFCGKNGEPVTILDEPLSNMVRQIRSCCGRSRVEEDFLINTIHFYAASFAMSCLAESETQLDSRLAGEMVRTIVNRTGILFLILSAADNEISTANTENLTRLAVSMTRMKDGRAVMPAFDLFARLSGIFEGLSLHMAEDKARHILRELGEYVFEKEEMGESSVAGYGHPIDSGIVKMLDTPMINGVFRELVNLNADTAMGQMLASSIPVTCESFPKLNAIVDRCVDKLKIKRPYVVVSNQVPGINAMTFGSDEEPYIAISSLLNRLMDEEEMCFVVGHECGHIAMGHVIYHTAASAFGIFSQYIPFVGSAVYNTISFPLNAWSRRSEITADRAGLICCESLDAAEKTLIHLENAHGDSNSIDIEDYLANSRRFLKGGMLRRIGEYGSSHPLTPKRIESLKLFCCQRHVFEMKGMTAEVPALTNKELAKQVEKIIKVL